VVDRTGEVKRLKGKESGLPALPTPWKADFQRLLESHGIVCSMSRRGNCWDNAAMESVFSTLKTERLSKKHYRTRDDLRADVFDYIESFYNPRRRHSTIGYLSPVQFENLKCA
jgi:putative transposase